MTVHDHDIYNSHFFGCCLYPSATNKSFFNIVCSQFKSHVFSEYGGIFNICFKMLVMYWFYFFFVLLWQKLAFWYCGCLNVLPMASIFDYEIFLLIHYMLLWTAETIMWTCFHHIQPYTRLTSIFKHFKAFSRQKSDKILVSLILKHHILFILFWIQSVSGGKLSYLNHLAEVFLCFKEL